MAEHEPSMYKIEVVDGELVGPDVVLLDLEAIQFPANQEPSIQISGQDVTRWTHSFCHPGCDRSATSTDLQALPARADPSTVEVADGDWVVHQFDSS
jgi:hypothetical protein